jgi:hypothetical protein
VTVASRSRALPPEPLTPEGIIATAQEAAREANARAAQLEAAARAGDTSVTPDDLQNAQQHAAWAAIQAEAAQHHAAERAEQLRKQAWDEVEAGDIQAAMADRSAEVEALLEQARPLVLEALRIAGDQNGALWRAAKYGQDDRNYSPVDADFRGYAPTAIPGAAYFDYRGRRYSYRPASTVLREFLRPMKREAQARSGGVSAAWLDEV